MLKVEEKVIYRAFELSLTSEIPLPELTRVSNRGGSVDIEIKIEDLSNLWFELSNPQDVFVVEKNLLIFKVPNVAIFSVQEGNLIKVSPMKEDYDEDILRLYILGSCMGTILMQRNVFPLHGSAVAIDGKAYAIIGDSGAGKSTLASAFLNKGFQLLTDDVIAISLSAEDKVPFVMPSYPQQKLWEDSLNNFGMEISDYQSIYGRKNKYTIPVTSSYCTKPLPLGGVFELVKTDDKEIEIRPIEKLEQFHTFFCHTYRNFLIPRLSLMDWHFNTSAEILDKVDVYQIGRLMSGFSAPQLVPLILNTINKGE